MVQGPRVLVVEDSADDAELMILALNRGGLETHWRRVETDQQLRAALAAGPWDVVLSDYSMPGCSAASALAAVRAIDPDMPFIVVSGVVGEDLAVAMMRAGANDYVLKHNLARLAPAVSRETREAENRRARRSVEQQTWQLAAIVSHAEFAIISQTLDGVVTTWNAGAERLYGYTAEEAIGRDVGFLLPEGKEAELRAARERIARGESVPSFDTQRLQKNGGRVDVALSLSPVRDAAGRVIAVSGIGTDITERKKAERDRNLLLSIIEYSPDFISIASPDENVMFVNRAGQALLGLSDDEEVRRTRIADYFGEAERQRVLNEVLPQLREGQHLSGEVGFKHFRDDVTIPTEWNVFAVPDPERGGAGFFACIAHDITNRKAAEQALRRSEERYRGLVESIPQLVWVYDGQGRPLLFNHRWYEFTGQTTEQAMADRWHEALHPDDQPGALALWERCKATGEPYSFEYRLRGADGVYRWFLSQGTPIKGPGGVEQWIGTCTDIDALKQAEAALRASEERYRLLFEANPHPMWVYDVATLKFLAVNDTAIRHYGYSREEFLAMTLRDIRPADDVERVVAAVAHLSANPTLSSPWRHVKKDGTRIDVEISSNEFRDNHRQARLVLALDVTERNRLEADSRRTANLLKAVADSVPDAVYVKDTAGRYLLFNEAAARFVGQPVSAVLGQDDTAIFEPESARLIMERDRLVMTTGKAESQEEVLTAAGVTRTYLATKAPYRDSEGNVIGLVGISRDISDRKLAEDALRASEERFRLFMNYNPAAAWITDSHGRMIYVSDTYRRTFKMPVEDPKGLTVFDLFPREIAQVYADNIRQVAATGCTLEAIEPGLRLDGTMGEFLVYKFPVKRPDGGVLVGGVAMDVTERKRAEELLREKDAKLAEAVRLAKIGYWSRDLTTGDVEWSDKLYDIFGVVDMGTKRTLESFLALVHPEDREAVANRIAHAEVTLESFDHSYRILVQGKVRVIHEVGRVIASETGKPIRVSGTAQDITERAQAEEALRASEERFRAFMDNSPATAFIKDAEGRYLYVNATWQKQFEPEMLDWHHKSDFDLWPRDTAKVFHASDLECLARGAALQTEETGIMPDGHECTWLVMKFPLQVAGHTRVGGMAWDISDRKRAEDALRMRDRAISAATQGIVITNPRRPDNPIVFASPGFERMTGYRAEEVLGRNCRFLQGSQTNPLTLGQLREAIKAGRPFTAELLNYRKDGAPFWNELSISPVLDSAGKLANFVGVQTDITLRRRLEEQFRQAQKMEAIGQLAGGVAHDFNNLLTIINGYCELLLRKMSETDSSYNLVSEIRKAGERSAGLTRQLLAFSRQQVLAPRVLDLNAIVKDTEKMLHRMIGEDIDLATALAPDLWPVQADPGQIEQVLLNLAVNARDAMPRGGRLTIETQNVDLDETYTNTRPDAHCGPHVLLTVTDTGTGMSPEVMARIFEPFFTTKPAGKGTGLGLATVYGIIRQSGGHIGLYSEIGVGTTFKIYLPRVESVAGDVKSPSTNMPPPRGTETILVVEDDESVRALTCAVLVACGYKVLQAADGGQASGVIAEYTGPIHMLVTDVVMPGLGGRALAEQVIKRYPNVRILFVSGYTDDAILRHGVLQEGVNFLQKPFSPAVLAHRVRDILDSEK